MIYFWNQVGWSPAGLVHFDPEFVKLKYGVDILDQNS